MSMRHLPSCLADHDTTCFLHFGTKNARNDPDGEPSNPSIGKWRKSSSGFCMAVWLCCRGQRILPQSSTPMCLHLAVHSMFITLHHAVVYWYSCSRHGVRMLAVVTSDVRKLVSKSPRSMPDNNDVGLVTARDRSQRSVSSRILY